MVKKVFLILIVLLICFANIAQAKTLEEMMQEAKTFIEKGESGPVTFEVQDISDTIYNILLTLGTVVAVIVAVVLGVQFITGSVEEKVKAKEALVPFVIGCVVIFGAFGIWKLAIELLR